MCDNGPEFTSQVLAQWAYERGIVVQPVKADRVIRKERARVSEPALNGLSWQVG